MNEHAEQQSSLKNVIISLSAGIFVGAAFFDALPEAAQQLGYSGAFIGLVVGFVLTYLLLPQFGRVLPFLIFLSGGAFIYIGLVSFGRRLSFFNAIGFAAGICVTLFVS